MVTNLYKALWGNAMRCHPDDQGCARGPLLDDESRGLRYLPDNQSVASPGSTRETGGKQEMRGHKNSEPSFPQVSITPKTGAKDGSLSLEQVVAQVVNLYGLLFADALAPIPRDLGCLDAHSE